MACLVEVEDQMLPKIAILWWHVCPSLESQTVPYGTKEARMQHRQLVASSLHQVTTQHIMQANGPTPQITGEHERETLQLHTQIIDLPRL